MYVFPQLVGADSEIRDNAGAGRVARKPDTGFELVCPPCNYNDVFSPFRVQIDVADVTWPGRMRTTQITPGNGFRRWRCGQKDTSRRAAGGRWRRQHRRQLKMKKSGLWRCVPKMDMDQWVMGRGSM